MGVYVQLQLASSRSSTYEFEERQKLGAQKVASLVAKCVRGETLDKFVMEIKPFHAVN
jgi:hypothetical protein